MGKFKDKVETKDTDEEKPKKKNRRCQHFFENGYQCNKGGVVSPNIRGEGPWFCCCAHGRLNGFF